MKRIFLVAMASSLLALVLPGVASAHHRRHHLHSDSGRTHRRHATPARVVNFGPRGEPSRPAPAAEPPSSDAVGKVASFTGETLTIELNDHSTVSGQVTDATEIRCHPATPVGPNKQATTKARAMTPMVLKAVSMAVRAHRTRRCPALMTARTTMNSEARTSSAAPPRGSLPELWSAGPSSG